MGGSSSCLFDRGHGFELQHIGMGENPASTYSTFDNGVSRQVGNY